MVSAQRAKKSNSQSVKSRPNNDSPTPQWVFYY